MIYLFVFLIVLCETIALSLLKQYALTQNLLYFFFGMLAYSAVAFFLVKSFRFAEMGIVNVLWSACSVVFVIAAGYLFFQEKIELTEALGIILVISGVAILRV